VRKRDLSISAENKNPKLLAPVPGNPYFEKVLEVRAKNEMLLFRVMEDAQSQQEPATTAPLPVLWRDKRFDTD